MYAVYLSLHPESVRYPVPNEYCHRKCATAVVIGGEVLFTTFAVPPVTFGSVIVMLFLINCQNWAEQRARYMKQR